MHALLPLLGFVLVAGFTQGATGFGFGMVVMSLAPLVMPVHDAVPLVSLLGLVVNGALLWHHRRAVRIRCLLPMAAGGLVGVPVGVTLLRGLRDTAPHLLMATLGVVLVAYAAHGLLRPGTPETTGDAPREHRVRGALAGLAGGVLGGAFNTGGPPVILHAAASHWPPATFKGVLQAFFLMTSILQVTLFSAGPEISRESLLHGGMLLPALLVGVVCGAFTSDRLDVRLFRRVVLVALLCLGSGFLARSMAG